MTATDAGAVRHKLDQALAQWRQWACEPSLPGAPHVLRALTGGVSNHSFLVEAAGRHFVVRVDGIHAARHGLNRAAEWLILQSAHAAGIAPAPRYFNPELGVLACDFLPANDTGEVALPALAALLRRIHALPPRRYRLDLAERIARYENLAARERDFALPEPLRGRIGTCLHNSGYKGARTLCHNDLGPGNLVTVGGGLYALDWEYAAMGNPWFDLAGAALGQGLAPGEDEALLAHYLGEAPQREQREEMRRQRALCRYIEMLWYVVESPAAELPGIAGRHLPLLEAELA